MCGTPFPLQSIYLTLQMIVDHYLHAPHLQHQFRVHVHGCSRKPQIKAVQDSYWKENRASNQEAPHCICKARKDVREPCNEARNTYDLSHYFFLSVSDLWQSCPWAVVRESQACLHSVQR
jgi:hypothetical protein